MIKRVLAGLLLAVLVAGLQAPSPAIAEQPTSAVAAAGRQITITITVGTPPGSPAGLYAQAVSRHMGRFLPGAPTIIVQHMPGAGGLVAANTAWTSMPRDGTALVSTNSAIFVEPLIGGKSAQFDARQFNWIGGTHVEPMLCITWHTSSVRTLQDAMSGQAIIGSYGADGPSAVFARAANTFVGTRFSLITGYSGGQEALIAMERGEVDGSCAMGWAELSLRRTEWLRQKKVNILFQMGLQLEPELSGVPLLLDQATSALDKKVLELLFTPLEIGRPIYAPPGVPPDRLRELRHALAQTLKDDAFLAYAAKAALPIRHVEHTRIEMLITNIYDAPLAVLDRGRRMKE